MNVKFSIMCIKQQMNYLLQCHCFEALAVTILHSCPMPQLANGHSVYIITNEVIEPWVAQQI